MAITRLSIDGYGARRAGSFAGRAEVIVVVPDAATTGGGGWQHTRIGRPLTKKELEKRFGLEEEAAEVIQSLAEIQANVNQSEIERKAQLTRELEYKNIVIDINHLKALNEQRELLVNQEIAKLLKMAEIEAYNEEFLYMAMCAAA